MPIPTKKDVVIVDGGSAGNFWLHDGAGTLFLWNGHRWDSSTVPHKSSFSRFAFIQTGRGSLLCAAIDQQWKTHFFKLEQRRWSKDRYVHEYPVVGLSRTRQGTFYAIGDWGSFLRYRNRRWEPMKTPLNNHVTSILARSEEDIFLGTSGKGVLHFDGKEFKDIPFPDKEKIAGIQLLETTDNVICAVTSTMATYWLVDGEFRLQTHPEAQVLDVPYSSGFAWQAMKMQTRSGRVVTPMWPKEFKYLSVKGFEDGTLGVTSRGGILYIGTPRQGNSFVDMANTFDVAGNSSQSPTGAAFLDVNGDLRPEPFVFNVDQFGRSKLYLNVRLSPFSDITESAGLARLDEYELFVPGDFDKDLKPDLAFFKLRAGGEYLDLFTYQDRFQQTLTLSRLPHFGHEELGNLQVADFDDDGQLDIALVHYRSPVVTEGFVDILSNSLWGSSFKQDTSLRSLSRGWNVQVVTADFDRDDRNDLFVVNKWQRSTLLLRRGQGWRDSTEWRFDHPLRHFCRGAAAVDFNNDGRLDLFLLTDSSAFQLFENRGNAHFYEVNNPLDSPPGIPDLDLASSVKSMSFGDFDNDGYTDMLYSIKGRSIERNYLFWNNQGKGFIDRTDEFGIAQPYVRGAIVADVDLDGDLDIFGIRDGPNVLWINNLDNKDFLSVSLVGVTSTSEGMGAKISVYDAGHAGEQNHLRGFRQIGSEQFGHNLYNSRVAHFGLDASKAYDLVVLFPSGHKILRYNLAAGQILVIQETEGVQAFFSRFPGLLYRFARGTEVKIYGALFLLSLFLLYYGTRFGTTRFGWNLQVTFFVVVSNLGLEALMIYLAWNSSDVTKYLLPLAILVLGVALPNFAFFWAKSHPLSLKSRESVQNELLQLLINFTHGQWALQNLNNMLLLCKNGPERGFDQDYVTQFDDRRNMYLSLINPEIHRIIALGKEANLAPLALDRLAEAHRTVSEQIEAACSGEDEHRRAVFTTLTSAFYAMRQSLEQIRLEVFSLYASDPMEVVRQVTGILQSEFAARGIQCERFTEYLGEHRVLIRSHELATVMSNLLQNSIQALGQRGEKKISIRLSRYASKVTITLTDTGCGIPRDDWEKIFERGYSGHSGTGQGLFHAREVLQVYGGRIFVRSSSLNQGTTFSIELNEVKQL